MGEVINMADYVERKAAETPRSDLTRRLAEITLEILLLGSEKMRIQNLLQERPENTP